MEFAKNEGEYEKFLKNTAIERQKVASGLTLDQIKFYIESYYPEGHNGDVFPREVMLKEGTLMSNKEILQEAFVKNKSNEDFIKYFICVSLNSEGKPHSEAVVYGVVDGKKFAITESISRSADLDDILNKEKDLKVQVVGIKLQNDYVNCGVFCIELVKHLGKDEIKNILQKITGYSYSKDFIRQGNCCDIMSNINKYLPAALASYKQSLRDEMAYFLKMKNDILKVEDEKEDIDKNKNADEDKKKFIKPEDLKIVRKIIHSYGVNNRSEVVEVNARADAKRQRIQWYYEKEQSKKNNNPINQNDGKKNCLIF